MGPRKGWVSRREDRAAVDVQLSAALVGRELRRVRYVELQYEAPGWDAGRFHTVDYGIEFELDDVGTWAVIWQQQGANETLLSYRGLIRDELRPEADVSTWDVTEVWQSELGRRVDRVETVWTRHRWGPAFGGAHFETQIDDGHESDYCLVSVLLRGEDGRCAVVTLGGDATDGRRTFTYLADDVAVFFSIAAARDAGALLPGDADALT
ncbi:MAG: hypothetical protein ABWZ91_08225 [Nocardioides sp.]